ncbi:MAG TPA: DNA-binding transcriptional regulator [Allosphingosinicella sp.]|jgi:putative transcriptional regulator
MPSKRYRSEVFRSIHSIAGDVHAIGAIDKATMRGFDRTCLTGIEPLEPAAIRHIRDKAGMSQAIFALTLNVTPTLVRQWERGEKKPSGPSLKLLNLADKKGVEAIL